jgi:heterodisulfide reductase subunit C
MISLIGMNISLCAIHGENVSGTYPISAAIGSIFSSTCIDCLHNLNQVCWWFHILAIFFFANYLPYSKHFHVFMSIPNVFFSRLEPLGKLPNMECVTREVKIMMNPELAYSATASQQTSECFGVKDIENVTWKNYIDSLSCTQCGRCSSVCPANTTGKKLSPRKLFMDLRARMNEKGYQLVKNNQFTDNKTLVGDYITEEELWACTTCNACAQECPVNINHPTFIVDMRRYLVMEKGTAPAELNSIFSNIENNGAPWQFSPEDRLIWTEK